MTAERVGAVTVGLVSDPVKRWAWPAEEPTGRILDCWVRLLTLRMTDCLGRYRTLLRDAEDREMRALRDAEISDAEWSGYRDAIDRHQRYVELVEADLLVLRSGRLPDLPFLDRQTHCRPGGCGRPKRRKFPARLMRSVTLANPPDTCRSCGWSSGGPSLELDHMAELWAGGPDAPFNLIRLCSDCHRQKPLWDEHRQEPVMYRMAALLWFLEGRVL